MGRAEDAEAKPADGEDEVSVSLEADTAAAPASPVADTVVAPASTEAASENAPPVDPPAEVAAEGADREMPALPETSP